MKRTLMFVLISFVSLILVACEGIGDPGTKRIRSPKAVNMGLSVKWGSFNIGAISPEEHGDHYAWGETTTKVYYDWSTYTLCRGGLPLTKYCTSKVYGFVDNKTVLEPEDDVAHIKLGGKWRMPTDAEWRELINTSNCTWTWTTQNGVNGYMVTSKKTGNSIFLPGVGGVLRGYDYSFSDHGYYWSSSLGVGATDHWEMDAWSVGIGSSGVSVTGETRCYGRLVRPVSEY